MTYIVALYNLITTVELGKSFVEPMQYPSSNCKDEPYIFPLGAAFYVLSSSKMAFIHDLRRTLLRAISTLSSSGSTC